MILQYCSPVFLSAPLTSQYCLNLKGKIIEIYKNKKVLNLRNNNNNNNNNNALNSTTIIIIIIIIIIIY